MTAKIIPFPTRVKSTEKKLPKVYSVKIRDEGDTLEYDISNKKIYEDQDLLDQMCWDLMSVVASNASEDMLDECVAFIFEALPQEEE